MNKIALLFVCVVMTKGKTDNEKEKEKKEEDDQNKRSIVEDFVDVLRRFHAIAVLVLRVLDVIADQRL